jgi:hypothetical protein
VTVISTEEFCLRRLAPDGGAGFRGSAADFQAAFCALHQLGAAVRDRSLHPVAATVDRISAVLLDTRFAHQRQAYFFYHAAADALRMISLSTPRVRTTQRALGSLRQALSEGQPAAQRAVMDVASQLPAAVNGPDPPCLAVPEEIPSIRWQSLLRRHNLKVNGSPRVHGRSLVASLGRRLHGRLLVLKMARRGDCASKLVREVAWMAHLDRMPAGDPTFRVPSVLRVGEIPIFRATGLPCRPDGIHPDQLAVGFIADGDYFVYPNAPSAPSDGYRPEVEAVLLQNARLLGRLAAVGIVHTAPIPLFHNRAQADRRRDSGHYDWFRGGRLDRWLASCRYPNFGPTGLRDFEHIIVLKGANRRLYRFIGAHLLSLLLVCASYFRNRDPQRVGFDRTGEPVDARDLFDPVRFRKMLSGIFATYYKGFTGRAFEGRLPFDVDLLVTRMIDELGVDRYMQEILRTTDQAAMSPAVFRHFLRRWGYSRAQALQMQPGRQDIVFLSGPHLGEFNGIISIPELTTAVGAMAAVCMLGRFQAEHCSAGQPMLS